VMNAEGHFQEALNYYRSGGETEIGTETFMEMGKVSNTLPLMLGSRDSRGRRGGTLSDWVTCRDIAVGGGGGVGQIDVPRGIRQNKNPSMEGENREEGIKGSSQGMKNVIRIKLLYLNHDENGARLC